MLKGSNEKKCYNARTSEVVYFEYNTISGNVFYIYSLNTGLKDILFLCSLITDFFFISNKYTAGGPGVINHCTPRIRGIFPLQKRFSILTPKINIVSGYPIFFCNK